MKKLTIEQKQLLMMTRKDTYPEKMICLNCQNPWMRHKGELCPDSRFKMYVPGNTRFIPDISSMDNNPQFDVHI